MKHNLSSDVVWKVQQDLLPKIIEVIHNPLCDTDIHLKSSIHPLIGNAEFKRVSQELENERFKTLINLARVLDDENMTKVINSLNYSLMINKI